MRTRISTKGQFVLPGELRRQLGIRAGDEFEVRVDAGEVILTPRAPRPAPLSIETDALTGLPVLTAPAEAPPLTSREVESILANFP